MTARRWDALALVLEPLDISREPDAGVGMERVARYMRDELDTLGLNLDDPDVLYVVLSTLQTLMGCSAWTMPLDAAVTVSTLATAVGASLAHLAPPEARPHG